MNFIKFFVNEILAISRIAQYGGFHRMCVDLANAVERAEKTTEVWWDTQTSLQEQEAENKFLSNEVERLKVALEEKKELIVDWEDRNRYLILSNDLLKLDVRIGKIFPATSFIASTRNQIGEVFEKIDTGRIRLRSSKRLAIQDAIDELEILVAHHEKWIESREKDNYPAT